MHVVDAAAENPIGDYRTVREVCFLLATKLNSWSTQICTFLSEKRKKKKKGRRGNSLVSCIIGHIGSFMLLN